MNLEVKFTPSQLAVGPIPPRYPTGLNEHKMEKRLRVVNIVDEMIKSKIGRCEQGGRCYEYCKLLIGVVIRSPPIYSKLNE